MSNRMAALGAALAAALGLAAPPATAQQGDQIVIVHNAYRTGPFSGSGIPIGDGVRDYFTMLNNRDGGIGGARIVFEECETAYDTRRSVECWEQARARNSVVYTPWSTGATLATVPRAHVDRMPIFSMAYGLSAAADGRVFPWVFNPPMTYWDAASLFLRYAAQREGGGLERLRGKTIGLVFLDAPFGREPIPLLENFAREYGFTVRQYPVAPTEMQNQSSLWLGIRRDRPDWIFLQGWGAMNPTAVREAGRAGFPVDRMVGVYWAGNEDDARPAGAQGRGYSAISWHQLGTNLPVMQDIVRHVVDRGQSLAQRERVGENLYNRGVYEGMLLAEGIRNAQRLSGRRAITGEDMRRGLEALNITAARWTELGAPDFAAPVRVTCEDHSGQFAGFVIQWDGSRWNRVTDFMEPIRDRVRTLIEDAARQYAASNQGWPQRTEPCDQRASAQ